MSSEGWIDDVNIMMKNGGGDYFEDACKCDNWIEKKINWKQVKARETHLF